ncbi:MAG: methyltransferase domain-containing protein [Melioribacteraceae bacterium]
MFKCRSYQKEIMDDFSITDDRIKTTLIELEIINKYLGGRSTSRKGIEIISRKIKSNNKITVLDVGSGGSDNFKYNNYDDGRIICLTSLDINKGVCRYVKGISSDVNIVCGDALILPFKESSFDIIHVSLFLHHFNEGEINNLMQRFMKISRYGVIVNDLHRSVFSYVCIKLLTSLCSKSEMVKNDGPLSVKRGFIKHELKDIFSRIKSTSVTIKYRWAFRWLAVIIK